MRHVVLVLDPAFGDQLRRLWPGRVVWIVTSPINDPVVQSLRVEHPKPNHLNGITTFKNGGSCEDLFLSQLPMIDLHHGPYSAAAPYTALEVIGAPATMDMRAALSEYGFDEFTKSAEGFSAQRSLEAAERLSS